MSKGAKTIMDLDRELAAIRKRDTLRSRDIKALRGDIDRVEQLLARRATYSPVVPSRMGTALERARLFFRRVFG